jgi:phosphopantothenoylcysteine decarboxylase / phosphopantothenate---cysteine ligase|tara:strand:- start:425 stop:1048 length:624 start_codon:yes stop_codon:yes gene_type:complete
MARFLVTAGPTREALDPVRYLSNRSSGKMGYAICDALVAAGHEVVLVSGPTSLESPVNTDAIQVESAQEMYEACARQWQACDALFAVAAVSDYRPSTTSSQKIKRVSDALSIDLVANLDIVKALAATKGERLVVGFALESENGEQHARQKLESKNLDFVCLNTPQSQGADVSELTVLNGDTQWQIGPCSKASLATELVEVILENSNV